MAGRHAADRFLRRADRADDVDREHALQPLGRDLVDTRRHADDAGIVYEPVELAEGGVDGCEDGGKAELGADVAFD